MAELRQPIIKKVGPPKKSTSHFSDQFHKVSAFRI